MTSVDAEEKSSDSIQCQLTDEQIDQLRRRGTEETVSEGDILVEEGEMEADFFVILEGEVKMYQERGGEKTVLGMGHPGQVGLMDVLDERPALATAVVSEPGRILRLSSEQIQQVVAEASDLSDLLLRVFLMRQSKMLAQGEVGLQIVGSRFSEATHRIKAFASRNDLPYTWLDLEEDEGAEQLLRRVEIPPDETPIVILRGEEVLRRPSNAELARAAGIAACSLPEEVVDLIVVGGGPAGLAATVYGASEGLATVCVEEEALGGRAGTTSKIENYLGFPSGLSGRELARRARLQARKFGAQLAVSERAVGLRRPDGHHVVELSGDETLAGRAVLIATGAAYRRLPLDRLDEFEGTGVYYAAREMQAQMCTGEDVVVVGGGNSAGQAVLFLSEAADQVHMLLRSGDLTKSMSRYLVDRVRKAHNVTVHLHTEATELHGENHLAAVTTENNQDETRTTIETPALFSFIGAAPCTDWLQAPDDEKSAVALGEKGFVLTGTALESAPAESPSGRSPHFLETSQPGVLAAGDVRNGSIKRVASAVGEGSMAVKLVHNHLGP